MKLVHGLKWRKESEGQVQKRAEEQFYKSLAAQCMTFMPEGQGAGG